jgi:hypothetical protein
MAQGAQDARVRWPSVYDVPGIEEFRFKVRCDAYVERQPYNLVIFGEKTSLLGPVSTIADRYEADVYLPSGEISDTLLHIMAKTGDADGREMIVFVVADCDPAGYQMTASIAHKLRALQELKFPNLRFRVEAPALTVEQVKEYGLPSTPLKETEKRAAGWLARYGVEQTEIDALATLQPQLFREIIEEAIRPYYDFDISERVADARRDWYREASGRLDAALEAADLTGLYADLEASLEDAEEKATALSERAEEVHVQLPEIDVPKSDIAEPAPAYISSEMDLLDAIQTLRARKDYGGARP